MFFAITKAIFIHPSISTHNFNKYGMMDTYKTFWSALEGRMEFVLFVLTNLTNAKIMYDLRL